MKKQRERFPEGGHMGWKKFRHADGAGPEVQLTSSTVVQWPASWSPDGGSIAFVAVRPDTGADITIVSTQGGHKMTDWLQTPFNEAAPTFSPDGRWIAYVSNESRRYEVYVRPYPGPGEKIQISTAGGTEPVWAHSGRELFYRHGDEMLAVSISYQPELVAGQPQTLFAKTFHKPGGLEEFFRPMYDISKDDQRFMMIESNAMESSSTTLNVVVNWFEDLRKRAPFQ